jgi:hypothetical protein
MGRLPKVLPANDLIGRDAVLDPLLEWVERKPELCQEKRGRLRPGTSIAKQSAYTGLPITISARQ